MITRTIKSFAVAAYDFDENDMRVDFGCVNFDGTAITKTIARKALIEAGIPCPKGCRVKWEEVGEQVYAISDEEFMAIARPIQR